MERNEKSCDDCSVESRSTGETKRGENEDEFRERQQLKRNLSRVKHKILILSGKGGVGKSSLAASLAVELARSSRAVGVLDIDFHGPSIPRLLGVVDGRAMGSDGAIVPVTTPEGILVMSMGFLLPNSDDAVIWRGPLKYGMVKQLLRDVAWGELDYLIVDSPPGTGDEPLSIAQLIDDADGAILVTTPQRLSVSDVRRSVNFARQLKLPVLGIVENMSTYVCDQCGASADLFGSGGGTEMALDMGVPFLGAVPLDAAMVPAADEGRLREYMASSAPGARAISDIAGGLIRLTEGPESKGAHADAE